MTSSRLSVEEVENLNTLGKEGRMQGKAGGQSGSPWWRRGEGKAGA